MTGIIGNSIDYGFLEIDRNIIEGNFFKGENLYEQVSMVW
jgi:hypothetical protein